MPLLLISEPADTPISIAEAKLHCRVDGSDDDAWMARAIASATLACENVLRRSLMTQQWEVQLDEFPIGPIRLAKPPIQAITSVRYIREDGTEITIAPEGYYLDSTTLPGWACCDPDSDWPADVREMANAVRVRFTSGYADAASVPAPIKQWILHAVGELYDSRALGTVEKSDSPFISCLLDRYVVPTL